ncbi:MAG: sulfite exporter TauE/SafE family protein [Flavobacteriales bacterium]
MDFLFYFIILALAAEIIGTVGGFGSSMLFVPIAGLLFEFQSVLAITALFHLSSNIAKIALFRKGFDKKLIIRIGIPAIVFVVIGAYLSRFFDGHILELCLSVFLIFLSLLLLISKYVFKPTTVNAIIGGALSGLTAGLFGTGGAIRGLTLAAFNIEKNVFITTSAIIDLGIDLSRSVVYFNNGYVKSNELYLIPILLVVSVVGTFIGKKILYHFSQQQFKHSVLIITLIIGVFTLLKQLL